MIIHTNSFRYFWEVYENNEYSFVFDKLRVLDLGCSEGSFSLWILPRAERIWAVDMDQNNINNFNKTIKDNDIKSVTTVVDRVTNLSEFMSGHSIDRVDLLKIDIEGDEYEIFERDDFPSDRITTIVGEYHGDDLGDILTKRGYRYIDLPNKHFIARK